MKILVLLCLLIAINTLALENYRELDNIEEVTPIFSFYYQHAAGMFSFFLQSIKCF